MNRIQRHLHSLPLLPLLVGALFGSLLASCSCRSHGVRPPWPAVAVSEKYLVLYPEPGIPHATIDANMKIAQRILAEYGSFFHYLPPDGSIRVILYGSRRSYESQVPVPVDTYAYYERRSHTIHIPVDSPDSIWRHELSHAVMENAAPGSPFWLQEGLAVFLQENSTAGFAGCASPRTAQLGEDFRTEIPLLSAKNALPGSLDFHHAPEEAVRYDSVYSAFFILYLWKMKMLTPMLHFYIQSHPSAPEFFLTKGNDRTWEKINADFREWIRKGAEGAKVSGC